MQLVGITTTQTYARRLGISSPLPAVPSLALGTGEMTLLDLTSAYGAFANGGIIAPHTLIRRIEDRHGNLIWQSSLEHPPYRAVRPGTAYLMSSMMADVMNRGTGSRARSEGFKLPAAGKTGTTDDYGDAWFVGYTPTLVAGVWFGHDEKKKIMNRGFRRHGRGSRMGRLHEEGDAREEAGVVRATLGRGAHHASAARADFGRRPPVGYRHHRGLERRTSIRTTSSTGTGPYETCAGDPHWTPTTSRRLRRFFLSCFDDGAHDAQPEARDRNDGDPGRAESQQARPVGQRSDDQDDADHVHKEVSHTASDAAGVPKPNGYFTGYSLQRRP